MSHIIAIDHGYSQMKTPSQCFLSSVTHSFLANPQGKNILQYRGVCYECGSIRQVFDVDKTRQQEYYMLTLIAIAKELDAYLLDSACSVTLAVDLPLEQFKPKEIKKSENT